MSKVLIESTADLLPLSEVNECSLLKCEANCALHVALVVNLNLSRGHVLSEDPLCCISLYLSVNFNLTVNFLRTKENAALSLSELTHALIKN